MEQPTHVSNSVLVTLFFAKPNATSLERHGFVVRFATSPRVGDLVSVDQYSIRQIQDEDHHQTEWKVAEVWHELSLSPVDAISTTEPLAALCVRVHPVKKPSPKRKAATKKAARKKK